jgi:hypothetical protein
MRPLATPWINMHSAARRWRFAVPFPASLDYFSLNVLPIITNRLCVLLRLCQRAPVVALNTDSAVEGIRLDQEL